MNVAMIQTVGRASMTPSVQNQSKTTANSGFGAVFSQYMIGNQTIQATAQSNPNAASTAEGIQTLLSASSKEEVLSAISQLIGEPATENQSLELDDIAQLLGVQMEDIIKALDQLLGDGLVVGNVDTWSLLDQISLFEDQFSSNLAQSLQGKGPVGSEMAKNVVAILKLLEVSIPQTDLVMTQEHALFRLSGVLTTIETEFTKFTEAGSARPTAGQLQEAFHGFKVAQQPITADSQSNTGQQQLLFKNADVHLHGNKPELTQSESLIREMAAIMKRSNFGQVNGASRLLIKMYPEQLGQVRIELVEKQGILTARILASTALGKEMLDSQLHQLRQAFVQQNIQVDRIDVAQALQDPSRNEKQQSFTGQFQHEQESNQENEEQHDEKQSFQEFLIELEV